MIDNMLVHLSMNFSFFSVRLYDVNTFQCFVGRNPSTHHTQPVSAVSKKKITNEGALRKKFYCTKYSYNNAP